MSFFKRDREKLYLAGITLHYFGGPAVIFRDWGRNFTYFRCGLFRLTLPAMLLIIYLQLNFRCWHCKQSFSRLLYVIPENGNPVLGFLILTFEVSKLIRP